MRRVKPCVHRNSRLVGGKHVYAAEAEHRQHARSWELRAAISLGRRWHRQRRDDWKRPLAPVYGWGEEGFDTADLQDARKLLATDG